MAEGASGPREPLAWWERPSFWWPWQEALALKSDAPDVAPGGTRIGRLIFTRPIPRIPGGLIDDQDQGVYFALIPMVDWRKDPLPPAPPVLGAIVTQMT